MTLPANTRAALDRARNSSDGRLDAATAQTLESAIQELWANIQKQPDDYVLTRDEFALFNYFRERFRGSSVAQKAVERYWNSLSASSSPDGCSPSTTRSGK